MKQKPKNQSNLNMIKSFFSDKLILLTGIFIIVGSLASLNSLVMSTTTSAFDDISFFSFKHLDAIDLPNTSSFVGILFILFYIFSKTKDNKIKTTFKIYTVYTNVNLALSALFCISIPLLLFIGLTQSSFSILYVIIYLLFTFPISVFSSLLCAYIERKYANALYDSATTSLSTEGAKEHSILCFISFGLSLLKIIVSIFTLSEFSFSFILFLLPTATINSISILLIGLVAKKYADTIPDEEYEEVVVIEEENNSNELTYPDLKNDTTEVCDQKYICEIDVNTNYEENLYDK